MKGDSFFMAANSRKSRGKQPNNPTKNGKRKHDPKENEEDDYVDGDVNFLDDDSDTESSRSSTTTTPMLAAADEQETAQEKRIRLAKEYICTLNRKKQQAPKRGDESGQDEDGEDGGDANDDDDYDAADIDRELVATRLRQEANQLAGKFINRMTSSVGGVRLCYQLRGHKSSATCLAVSPRCDFAYSGGKDGLIIQWCLKTGKRLHTIRPTFIKRSNGENNQQQKQQKQQKQHAFQQQQAQVNGHSDQILALSVSADGQFLASGGKDRKICIWRTADHSLVQTFAHHRDAVTGLSFRRLASNMLYSVSADRTLKLFNLDEMAYVETLFGHQDVITAVDSMGGSRERCLSTGHRDRTVRLWKIIEESQLVFRASSALTKRRQPAAVADSEGSEMEEDNDDGGESNNNNHGKVDDGKDDDGNGNARNSRQLRQSLMQQLELDETGSLECVSMLDDEHWVTGSDGGVLAVWNMMRKKPIYSLPNAHGRCLPLLGDRIFDSQSVDSLLTELSDQQSELLYQHQQQPSSNPLWVTAVACMPYSDLLASGSRDGLIRLWRVRRDQRLLEPFMTVECPGFINALQFSADGRFLVAAVGQEHRLGRWTRLREARNGLRVFELTAQSRLDQS